MNGFTGMPNLVGIFSMMSDTKRPTGGHFCSQFSTFLLITSNHFECDIASYSKKGYAETSGDIGNDVRFKMADWQQSSIEMDDSHSLH